TTTLYVNNMKYIVRYSEIGVKSDKARAFFEDVLVTNIKKAIMLKDAAVKISKERGRIYVETAFENAITALSKIFGISSYSPVKVVSTNKIKLIEEISGYAAENLRDASSFAVRCKRIGTHPYTSRDIEREAGAKIIFAFNNKLKVNLDKPDKTIFVEIREKEAYIFHQTTPGPGGLPVGTQGRFVSLISGGIDSPVAAYMMMKRGAIPVILYFDNTPYSTSNIVNSIIEIGKKLEEYASYRRIPVYSVPHGAVLQHITDSIPGSKYICLLCKRSMLRIAERLAVKLKAEAIVTGESIGQKASQTMRNMLVISNAVKTIPVIRPLVTFDKLEIETIAKKIGTYPLSLESKACCVCAPKHPSIKAELEMIEKIEESLGLQKKLSEAFDKIRKINKTGKSDSL
ncbi:MAG: tRNA uracil 4-sulfurtransferase ThiI, partial [Candidatus Odinarchaeota archaeon]